MPFVEDFAVFLNADTPGYTLATVGGVSSIGGIFDNGSAAALGGLVESAQPQIVVASADIAANAIAQGTPLVVASVAYKVREVQPDGTGLTTLMLELA